MKRISVVILNKELQHQVVSLLPKSISNYVKTGRIFHGKAVYAKPEILERFLSLLPKRKKWTRRWTGTTHLMGKKYVKYLFPLRRFKLISAATIDNLLEYCKKKYMIVWMRDKHLSAMRIMIEFGQEKRLYSEWVSKDTGRNRKREVTDKISVGSYERAFTSPLREKVRDEYFKELRSKIFDIYFEHGGKGKSPSLLDEKALIEAVRLFVVFDTGIDPVD